MLVTIAGAAAVHEHRQQRSSHYNTFPQKQPPLEGSHKVIRDVYPTTRFSNVQNNNKKVAASTVSLRVPEPHHVPFLPRREAT